MIPTSRNFFNLVRQQSALKRKSNQSHQSKTARAARQQCHKHFWNFAREQLDDSTASKATPEFSEEEAFQFFHSTYQSTPRSFEKPTWMPTPKLPTTEFEGDLILPEEVQRVINRSKSSSSPSPFDQIPYQIFKRCPSLNQALVDLFNCCWTTSSVPAAWKTAAIKLIGKSSASEDPTVPSNFKPIALTSCIGKLFTTVLKNRWLEYMLDNDYLDRDPQAIPSTLSSHSLGRPSPSLAMALSSSLIFPSRSLTTPLQPDLTSSRLSTACSKQWTSVLSLDVRN